MSVAHNFIDITGKRYGRLTVMSHAGTYSWNGKAKESQWLCRCDCGVEKVISKGQLRGQTKSCGCFYRETRRNPKKSSKPRLPFGHSARNNILKGYKVSAGGKGMAWDIDKEKFFSLISSNCFYCGCTPSKRRQVSKSGGHFMFNGLDRVDNYLGYVISNVVPCCSICNHAKATMTQSDFLSWIIRLVSHYQNKNA